MSYLSYYLSIIAWRLVTIYKGSEVGREERVVGGYAAAAGGGLLVPGLCFECLPFICIVLPFCLEVKQASVKGSVSVGV